jgi:hypothetical protein
MDRSAIPDTCDEAAGRLERAAAHLRSSGTHWTNAELARYGAHLAASMGDVAAAIAAVEDLLEDFAAHSTP